MPSSIPVTELIASSMRLIGALASGETATANEINDGLLVLNDLYENWSTERLSVWGAANETFALVPGQATYTIGAGGNFNTVRPVVITDAYCTFSGVDFPIEIVPQDQYNRINLKTMQQPIVEQLLYVNDFPLGLITLWPVPSGANTITLSTGRVLNGPIVATDVLTGPPGFMKAMRFCLALELAPEYGIEPSGVVVQTAADSKGDYKRSNQTDVISRMDDALTVPPVALYQRGY